MNLLPQIRTGLTAAVSLQLTDTALAQDVGSTWHQFSPPAGDTAVSFLSEVFGPVVNLVSNATSASAAAGGTTNTVLGSMMAVYCSAVIFLGMVFVAYTSIKATVNSAHDGEFLGRTMHATWVPLRSVAGIAFLLPLGAGYSFVQIGLMWATLQGVGIADAVWNAGMTQLQATNMIAQPLIPNSRPLAASILESEVCMFAMNQQYAFAGRSTQIIQDNPPVTVNTVTPPSTNVAVGSDLPNGATTSNPTGTYTTKAIYWHANDNSYINPNVCGGLEWKDSWSASSNSSTQNIKSQLMTAHVTAVQTMISTLQPIAQSIVAGTKPDPGALDNAANAYEQTLRAAAQSAMSSVSGNSLSDFTTAAKSAGWIFAGTWYNQIAKLNDAMQSTLNALPTVDPITITDKETAQVLQTYSDAMTTAQEYAKNNVSSVRQAYYAATDVHYSSGDESSGTWWKKVLSAPFMGLINQTTQLIAGSNLNHMSQMKAYGDYIVGTAEGIMTAAAIATGTGSSIAANVTAGIGFNIGAVMQFFSPFITVLILMLLACGVTLSVYMPLVPFITWTTSVVNWFVLVVEAMIAGPLFAVAHAHPDGDDVSGKAGPGWMLILSLLVRPTLMIFGLICAMLLTEPIVGFINAAYMTVVAGIQADSLTGVVSYVAYVSSYVLIMTSVVHIVFSLIHWIPDNILRWVGGIAGGIHSAQQAGEATQGRFESGVQNVRQHAGLGGDGPSPSSDGADGGGVMTASSAVRDPLPDNKDLLG
jgi:conjugal transfer/type IV secretion protein DotA/TraY